MITSPFENSVDIIGSKSIAKNLKVKLDEFMKEPNNFDRRVFGIFGSWGIGKSTILDEIAFLYDNHLKNKTRYKIIRIDLWKYELLNNDLEAITNDILMQISKNYITKRRFKKVFNYIVRMINGTRFTYGLNIPTFETQSILKDTSRTGKTLFEINNVDDDKKIGDFDKVLIVFDELDRCSRVNMERYLNYIKNISAEFSSKIYSAVVLDKNYLAETLFNKDPKHCNKFLEKIIKFEFDVEQKMVNQFEAAGEKVFPDGEFLSLVKCCDNNIRKIRRILDEIKMLLKVTKGKDNEERILVAKLIILLKEINAERVVSSRSRLEQVLNQIDSKQNNIAALNEILKFFNNVETYENGQVENKNFIKDWFEERSGTARNTIDFDNGPILASVENFIFLDDFKNWIIEFKLNNIIYKLKAFPFLVYILGDTKVKVRHNIMFNSDIQLNWSEYFESEAFYNSYNPFRVNGVIHKFDTTKIATEFMSNKKIEFNVSSSMLIEFSFPDKYEDNHFLHFIVKMVVDFFSNKKIAFLEGGKRIINYFLEMIDFL
jgi:hypothetical protein